MSPEEKEAKRAAHLRVVMDPAAEPTDGPREVAPQTGGIEVRGFVGPQRRGEVRVRCAAPIELVDDKDRLLRTVTRDLSVGGARILHAEELRIGQRLHFMLDLRPEGHCVEGEADVVRDGDLGMRGLRFHQLGLTVEDQIARYVFTVERRLLQTGRGSS